MFCGDCFDGVTRHAEFDVGVCKIIRPIFRNGDSLCFNVCVDSFLF